MDRLAQRSLGDTDTRSSPEGEVHGHRVELSRVTGDGCPLPPPPPASPGVGNARVASLSIRAQQQAESAMNGHQSGTGFEDFACAFCRGSKVRHTGLMLRSGA